MSLAKKITLLTVLWLVSVLFCFNLFVYFFVLRIATNTEMELVRNKAETILSDEKLYRTDRWSRADFLLEWHAPGEVIRLLAPDGNVINQTMDQEPFPESSLTNDEPYRYEIVNTGTNRYIFLRVPIYAGQKTIGMLELGRRLGRFQDFLEILFVALLISSIGSVVVAVCSGYLFTKWLLKPLRYMISTIHEIQKTGKLRKIKWSPEKQANEFTELAEAFNAMIDELEINFRKQKQFAADASHELKTPITVIESYANLLRRWGGKDDQIRDEAVEAIYSEAIRLKEITSSLLLQAEAEDAGWLNKTRFDIVSSIRLLTVVLQQTFQRVIRVEAGEEPIMVEADEEKIKQLLIILLDNAMKYSMKSILIRLSVQGKKVLIQVIDQGIGIPETEIPYLFERFYRVDKDRNRSTGGAGLGLSIAKKIVELHEGNIRILSKVNEGTTVQVLLPLAR